MVSTLVAVAFAQPPEPSTVYVIVTDPDAFATGVINPVKESIEAIEVLEDV